MTDPATTQTAIRPQWFSEQVLAAQAAYEALPVPIRLDEQWRFGARKGADFSAFVPAVPRENYGSSGRLLEDAVTVEILNGIWSGVEGVLPDGLEILSLERWIASDEAEARDWLGREVAALGSAPCVAWNRAMMTEAVVVKVRPGVCVETPVEIIWRVEGESAAIFPYTLVLAGEASSINLLERHVGSGYVPQLAVGVQRIETAPSSFVRYALLQQMTTLGSALEVGQADLRDNARVEHLSAHSGALWTRQELTSRMLGSDAWAELMSVASLDGHCVLDQRTHQAHLTPGSGSNLMYKTVLRGASRNVFAGMIRVEEGAHGTDAYQSNRNLLLSNAAESDSLPGLEILADGVRCSHGTATSSIDPEEVFYLLSRGIPKAEAERMIAAGFLHQASMKFGYSPIVEAVMKSIER